MDKKNRRYEIHSKVHVPNMEDIQRAASDFTEASEEQKHDFVAHNAKHFISTDGMEKHNPKLNDIKKEMVHLAMVVASDETEQTELVDEAHPTQDIIQDEIE